MRSLERSESRAADIGPIDDVADARREERRERRLPRRCRARLAERDEQPATALHEVRDRSARGAAHGRIVQDEQRLAGEHSRAEPARLHERDRRRWRIADAERAAQVEARVAAARRPDGEQRAHRLPAREREVERVVGDERVGRRAHRRARPAGRHRHGIERHRRRPAGCDDRAARLHGAAVDVERDRDRPRRARADHDEPRDRTHALARRVALRGLAPQLDAGDGDVRRRGGADVRPRQARTRGQPRLGRVLPRGALEVGHEQDLAPGERRAREDARRRGERRRVPRRARADARRVDRGTQRGAARHPVGRHHGVRVEQHDGAAIVRA
jgi:hypothetical protein